MVMELKRTEDGGHMELQAIRYAAMVANMTFKKAVEVYGVYLEKCQKGRRDEAKENCLPSLIGKRLRPNHLAKMFESF